MYVDVTQVEDALVQFSPTPLVVNHGALADKIPAPQTNSIITDTLKGTTSSYTGLHKNSLSTAGAECLWIGLVIAGMLVL